MLIVNMILIFAKIIFIDDHLPMFINFIVIRYKIWIKEYISTKD